MQFEFDKTNTGWIVAGAGIAAVVALLMNRRVGVRLTPNNELALERTTELMRVPPSTAIAGAAATVALAGLGLWQLHRNRADTGPWSVEETIDLNVPVSTAYNQWTQFEEFPRFMATVENVRQIDDQHLHWRANVGGKTKEWDSEITEQIPDQKIAWRSTGGVRNSGTVTFDKIGDNKTRVKLQMDYAPESADEKVGSALGGVKFTAKGNLKRFKHLVEARGVESGAWRGEIGARH
jgi:uncharacterized membrane protein